MNFIIGCNYWASNAGADMWKNWDEKAVREDFKILKENGIGYLRVFPNWRDFQPVMPEYSGGGVLKKYSMEDGRDPENIWFLDPVCLERFGKFCDICEEYGFKIIVSIVTGWMSGKLFIPPVLYGKNLYTDPTALYFEQKLVQGIVRNFKNKKAIYAWSLGNECDCLPNVGEYSPDERVTVTSMWSQLISNAIRAEDGTRQIFSGLTEPTGPERTKSPWNPKEHGNAVDVMTAHPYSYFRAYASNDYFESIRTTMHATAVTSYIKDLSGKPAVVEEIGTLGTSLCEDRVSAEFMRINLLSNWANGNGGLLWWCANEQNELRTAPYSWCMLELELGLTDRERKPKKYLEEMKKFSEFLKCLDFDLPEAKTDAVCIVPSGLDKADSWGVAFSSYILAKQAKINVKFAYSDDEIPESEVYILPCINSTFSPKTYFDLRKRVEKGAMLYLSNSEGFLENFKGFTGVEIIDSAKTPGKAVFEFKGEKFEIPVKRRYKTRACGAKVLGEDGDGNPVITENKYGKGKVFFLNAPLEESLMTGFDRFSGNAYKIYGEIFSKIRQNHVADSDVPCVAITEHFTGENEAIIVAINHSGEKTDPKIIPGKSWKITENYRGTADEIGPFDGIVLKAEKC